MGRGEITATFVIEDAPCTVSEVVVVSGPDSGARLSFEQETAVVGTGDSADLRLTDRQVSRMHCELVRDPGRLRIRDLGSKNGVWLGQHRVYEAEVAPGAQVRIGGSTLEARVAQTRAPRPVWRGPDQLGEMLGGDPRMHELFAQIARLAPTDTRVLIAGESGTGKELVARALHQLGPRAERPFVVVDGGTLSRTLADSELFGHVRGAFTDAREDRAGAFERAHGGTVFLDEVGEIPLEVQPKLLRVLEDGSVQRVGGTGRVRVDVRVIAATNRPLHRMVAEGSFREDLYHRLRVVQLTVPPLRERPGDIPLIARAVLSQTAPGDARAAMALEKALAAHAGYRWPGNVRELRSMVRRVAVLGEAAPMQMVQRDDDEGSPRMDLPYAEAKRQLLESFERRYLRRLLDETGGNVTEAAKRAGMNRSHLSTMVTKLGLRD